ncbi:MAG: GspE/PulE family protein [Romboutsia sp.]
MDIILKVKSDINNLEFNYKETIKLDEDDARNLFKGILEQSIKENASDIHIEPFDDKLIIRIRVDGELKEAYNLPINSYQALSSVIKLEVDMNIMEKRLPQDGRADIKLNNKSIDIRASSIPTIYGEKIVLRILNREVFFRDKKELGFLEKDIDKIKNILNKNSGLILIAGPTGSGKTTTVYSILNDLRKLKKNIITIEDPVEYKIDGINQIQVNDKLGLNFNVGLRSILRQDPDIIMVGEIRDIDTAKIAIRAAMTGHLVISTIHTNDSISSIARLIDMQIPTYMINASLIGIISQKLVKKVCTKCSHDILINHNNNEDINTKVARVCDYCKNTGYIGRTGIYEILEISEEIKNCIKEMKDYNEIKEVAIKEGMITFKDRYERLIKDKITTLEECIMINNI